MTQQVNEFGVLGITSVPAMYASSMAADVSMTAAVPEPVPASPVAPVTSVYVVSTDVVNGTVNDGDVLIDMVLNVTVSCVDSYRTFKVLKRLSLNRDNLAAEAMNCETVRVEEKLDPQQQDLKRLRDLIGR